MLGIHSNKEFCTSSAMVPSMTLQINYTL